MFRPKAIRFAARVADAIDDMLVGDFDLIEDESGLYADVDYERTHPCQLELHTPRPRRGCNAPVPAALTSAALQRR